MAGMAAGWMMEGLTFRRAAPADTDRIAEIIYGNPPHDLVGILLDEERTRKIGREIVRLPNSPQGWQRTVLAELDGEPLGVLQASNEPVEIEVTPALALAALRVYGPVDTVRLLPRLRALRHVRMNATEGAYVVSELHVDAQHRNRGIGGALLDYAEREAREKGCRLMSLVTHTANAARRLYERYGFHVVETRTDVEYERYSGIEGRVHMVKELG
jgi:ribosomal protein S18 acetylase RimI-like enzyme